MIEVLKLIIFAVFFVFINAIISNLNSVMHYLNIRRLGPHDIDFLPMCIIIPILIISLELGIYYCLKLIYCCVKLFINKSNTK